MLEKPIALLCGKAIEEETPDLRRDLTVLVEEPAKEGVVDCLVLGPTCRKVLLSEMHGDEPKEQVSNQDQSKQEKHKSADSPGHHSPKWINKDADAAGICFLPNSLATHRQPVLPLLLHFCIIVSIERERVECVALTHG